MVLRWLRLPALVAPLLLAGCGLFASRSGPQDVAPEDAETRLPAVQARAEEWLALPRADLAKLCVEQEKAIADRLESARRDPDAVELLPTLRVPAQGPVFRRAAFRPAAGLMLPEYARDAMPDAAVALHLARHGDQEAAAKLGGAPDALKVERGYPVEWTRLVGLSLVAAQMKLATGDPESAALLIRTHEQLVKLLGPKARASALGAALLPSGRRALQMAARAWRDPSRNKTGLAEDIEKALKDWGDMPAGRFPDVDAARLASIWGGPERSASEEARRDRVLDLLDVPLPAEGMLAVATSADADGKLAGVQAAYRSDIDTLYPVPAHLAYWLEERGWLAGAEHRESRFQRQEFMTAHASMDIVRSSRSPLLGAMVTFGPARPATPAARPRSLRAFGPVDLDRPFSVSRFALDPTSEQAPVLVSDKPSLEKLAAGLDVPAPTSASFEREDSADLPSAVRLAWASSLPTADAGRLLAGLWGAYGPSSLRALDEKEGSALALEWKDGSTRAELRLPFDDKGPVLSAIDAQPVGTPRLARALELAASDRKARIAAGKPDLRLVAGPARVNGVETPGLRVGKPKEEAEASLAKLAGEQARRADRPDGASVTLLTTPPAGAQDWVRQVLVRYADDKVTEVRVRWQAGPGPLLKADPRLGPGEPIAASWDGLWRDVSSAKALARRWRDDVTVRTIQRDASGAEATWASRPGDDAPAKPWRFVSRGPEGAELGDDRARIVKALGEPAAASGGADVFRMPKESPYEMALVWFEAGKAARIVGVQRAKVGSKPEEALRALQAAWGRDVPGLGFVRRQEPAGEAVLGAMGWHDDETRVRMSVQAEGMAARLTTEWRTWPVPAPAVVAAD